MTYDRILPILAKKPMFADQDVLNIVFRNHFHKLPPEYNASIRYRLLKHDELVRWMNWNPSPYMKSQLDDTRHHPVIIHYTWSTLGRPWEKGCLDPWKEQWIFYFERSPWKGIMPNAVSVSKKKRLMGLIYQYCPLNFFMFVEYRYFKYSFLKTLRSGRERCL